MFTLTRFLLNATIIFILWLILTAAQHFSGVKIELFSAAWWGLVIIVSVLSSFIVNKLVGSP